jgi:hypothetical protein
MDNSFIFFHGFRSWIFVALRIVAGISYIDVLIWYIIIF